ncbi:MAG: VOC family protein [Xanthomonadales bacterium]|nr:VOC family protein [Xanthomonadales bacterium]ODU74315.1 MAG: glyoxalase [Rhodanobacter sp. SCN 69-32]OJY84106.1 MAG: glyoxalase/bleomycin resistance/dioxygenase family protein [Xanthomonadales bacterium 66-474]
MKRFHVHVNVNDLDASIRFYSTLFGSTPTVHKSDYAKWMLEDPRVNFAISQRDRAPGVDHLGLQAEDGAELKAFGERLMAADAVALAEQGTTCCYAHSDKYWAEDPQGVRWETFHTHGEATIYSAPAPHAEAAKSDACCGPQSSCCGPKARAAGTGA